LDLFLVTSQGIGSALSAGVRAAVAALVVGLLAAADLGVDFDGTDFAFLESAVWLAAAGLLTLGGLVLAHRRASIPTAVVALIAAAVGALLFGGSLADEGDAAWPGLMAGAACGLLGYVASHAFFAGASARARARTEDHPVSFMELIADVAAAILAGLAVAIPPVSLLALAFAGWVLIARRRRSQQKYEGLRILR
jgi:Domain of unknown function (DUF4126)